jgi:serine/threonine protein kinase
VKQDIIINEIQIMKDSHHHAIVNYIDSYIVEGTLWVVMELINGGSLAELIEVASFAPLPLPCVHFNTLSSVISLSLSLFLYFCVI